MASVTRLYSGDVSPSWFASAVAVFRWLPANRISLRYAFLPSSSSSYDSHSTDGGITEPVVFTAKSNKKISSKDSPRTSLNSLNKFKSQIKKPSHKNGSPLNWIPRQKGDTYLKTKIQQLQEASGMNSTLDETLGPLPLLWSYNPRPLSIWSAPYWNGASHQEASVAANPPGSAENWCMHAMCLM